MSSLYFSPMLLGLCLLVAIAIAATALWRVSRPYSGPGFWMAGTWSIIAGIVLFIGFMVTGSPTLNVLGNAGQLAGEAIFLLGIFRFMGRPLPLWLVPASVGVMVAFNVHYWVYDGNSDFLMGVYSTIAGLLPINAIRLLLSAQDDQATRPARRLVAFSLVIYSAVTLLRGLLGYWDWWHDYPYEMPYESFSYLLPYNFAIPALVMGFIGVSLMTMQRILAESHQHAQQANDSARRFERLMGASSSGVAILRGNHIVDANPGLEKLTGRTRDEVINQAVETLFDPGSHEELRHCLALPDVRQRNLTARHPDGGSFAVEISLFPLNHDNQDRILELRDISHHKALEAKLKALARHDPLTGSLNRRAFEEAIETELERAGRYGHGFCVSILDLDHFKRINDDFGHTMGDKVLVAVSDCCRRHLRATDIFARFGGEEFVILLVDTDLEHGLQLLSRVQEAVRRLRIPDLPDSHTIRLSAGLTQWQTGDTLDALIRRADQGLYDAKRGGRDRIHTIPPVDPSSGRHEQTDR